MSIVDFTFNPGAGRLQLSTLRRRVNQRDWIAAGQELRRRECARRAGHATSGRSRLATSQRLSRKRAEELGFRPKQRVHVIPRRGETPMTNR